MSVKKMVYGFDRISGQLVSTYPSIAALTKHIGSSPAMRDGVAYLGPLVYNVWDADHAPVMRHTHAYRRPSVIVYRQDDLSLTGIYESASDAATEHFVSRTYLTCLLRNVAFGEQVEAGDFIFKLQHKWESISTMCQPMPHERIAVYSNRGNFQGVFSSLKDAVHSLFPKPETGVSNFIRRMQWRVITDLQDPLDKIRAVAAKGCPIKVTTQDGASQIFKSRTAACAALGIHPDVIERSLRGGRSYVGITAEWVRQLPESASAAPAEYAVLVISPSDERYYYPDADSAARAFGVSRSRIGQRARVTHAIDGFQIYAVAKADAEGKPEPPTRLKLTPSDLLPPVPITATVVSRRVVTFK